VTKNTLTVISTVRFGCAVMWADRQLGDERLGDKISG